MLIVFTLIAFAFLGGGPLAAHFSFFSPLLSLAVCAIGLLLLTLLFFAAVAKLVQRGYTNWFVFFFGLLALAVIGALAYQMHLNPLHDITSDSLKPPQFMHPAYPFLVEKGSEYLDESLRLKRDYNPPDGIAQAQLYPDFTALAIKAPAADAYAMTLKTVQTQNPEWKIVLAEEKNLHFEAEVEDPVFRSLADIAVEVRSDPKQPFDSKIEMRSRLRESLSDFGWDIFLLRGLRTRVSLAAAPLEKQFAQKRAEFESNAGKPKSVEEPPKAAPPATPPAALPKPAPKKESLKK